MTETDNPALSPEEWRFFTQPGVHKHVLQDAIGAGERGRMDLHPHALAALALHGQPFGFTHEDVAYLRGPCQMGDQGLSEQADHKLLALADRIAALLPAPTP